MQDKTILIMAGGTGGHIYPALAVADKLKAKGFKLYWLGSEKGMEAEIVPDYGYPLLKINVAGIRGNGLLRLLLAPFMLIRTLIQAIIFILKIRPVAVLGMGGFASGPGGIAAWIMRVPLLIHEQNAISGLTNRLLSPFAVSIMAAFPDALKPSKKLSITGNPIRENITNIITPEQRYLARDKNKLKIFVLGGSRGAKKLNQVVPQAVIGLDGEFQYEIKHQCGQAHIAATQKAYEGTKLNVEVVPFIKDIAEVYAWADVVICRAGALTVSELAAAGTASILVPFPYAVDDHQTANANYLAKNDAAVLLQEADLTDDKIRNLLIKWQQAPELLLDMATKARALAKPTATTDVMQHCLEVIDA